MTSSQFAEALTARAAAAGLIVTPEASRQLEAYVQLLRQWNAKINLTALRLDPLNDEAVDRLLIEPLVAARFVAAPQAWCDIGSGGGSPAIPFKIVHPAAKLTMVESTGKKAAFLREAIRVLNLTTTVVSNERFESAASKWEHAFDLVTVRAVRSDPALFQAIHRAVTETGQVFIFHSAEARLNVASQFTIAELVPVSSGDAMLSILKPNVPRGTKG